MHIDPLTLLDSSVDAKVLLVQPRRFAVLSLSARLAKLREEPLGRTLGYRMGDMGVSRLPDHAPHLDDLRLVV